MRWPVGRWASRPRGKYQCVHLRTSLWKTSATLLSQIWMHPTLCQYFLPHNNENRYGVMGKKDKHPNSSSWLLLQPTNSTSSSSSSSSAPPCRRWPSCSSSTTSASRQRCSLRWVSAPTITSQSSAAWLICGRRRRRIALHAYRSSHALQYSQIQLFLSRVCVFCDRAPPACGSWRDISGFSCDGFSSHLAGPLITPAGVSPAAEIAAVMGLSAPVW